VRLEKVKCERECDKVWREQRAPEVEGGFRERWKGKNVSGLNMKIQREKERGTNANLCDE
jgi:hypothetical protein